MFYRCIRDNHPPRTTCTPGYSGPHNDCTSCAPWTYTDRPEMDSYTPCTAGTKQNCKGATDCETCAAGKFFDMSLATMLNVRYLKVRMNQLTYSILFLLYDIRRDQPAAGRPNTMRSMSCWRVLFECCRSGKHVIVIYNGKVGKYNNASCIPFPTGTFFDYSSAATKL